MSLIEWGGLHTIVTEKPDFNFEELPEKTKTLFSKLKEIENTKFYSQAWRLASSISDSDANYLNSPVLDELRSKPKLPINKETVRFLHMKGFDKRKIFNRCCSIGYLELLKQLVNEGVDFYLDNYLSLKLASMHGHLEIVKYLVEIGANFHSNKERLLTHACMFNRLEIVKYLVEHGADIHVGNDYPLQLVCQHGDLEMVKYLVENGANIHANNDYPLREASRYSHLELVKYLVENGANIHANNDSALRSATQNGNLKVVKYLVEHGANIHAFGNEPVQWIWSCRKSHREVVKYLEEQGVKPNIFDRIKERLRSF